MNNNSLQNISLLKDINNDEPKYQELNITLSEIMNNPSFKRLYTYSLKLYGKCDGGNRFGGYHHRLETICKSTLGEISEQLAFCSGGRPILDSYALRVSRD